MLAGRHTTETGAAGTTTLTAVVFEVPFSEADTVTAWSDVAPLELRVNVALLALAATLTVAGPVTPIPLSAIDIVVPAAGAGPLNVTVQATVPGTFTEPGVHERLDRTTGPSTFTLAARLLPFSVAVTVTARLAEGAPAVALNVALSLPAGIRAEAGTVSAALLEDSATGVPPAGAALESVTVQTLVFPASRAAGLQSNADIVTAGAVIESVVVLLTPLRVAVMLMADSEMVVPTAAMNRTLLLPAGTTAEAGMVTPVLLLDN
jgi:hypothetical protein